MPFTQPNVEVMNSNFAKSVRPLGHGSTFIFDTGRDKFDSSKYISATWTEWKILE